MSVCTEVFLSIIFLLAVMLSPLYSQTKCGPQGCAAGNGQPLQYAGKEQPEVVQSFYGNTPPEPQQQPVKTPAREGREGQQKPPVPKNVSTAKTPSSQQKNSQHKDGAQKHTPIVDFAETPPVPHQSGEPIIAQSVLPEVASQVQLSSSDINRVVCPVDIKDVVFSKEKGITIKLAGNNAFVKFLVMKKNGRDYYSSTPSEIFIACGDNIYNIIAIPKRIPSQTIQLSPGKAGMIKKNASLFGELPFEKKVVTIIKNIYREDLPDSFSTQRVNKQFETFQNLHLVLHRIFTIDGEGLRIKEYRARLADHAVPVAIHLKEKDFLNTELAQRPVAVSIDVMNLRKGEMSRIFVVERTEGGQL